MSPGCHWPLPYHWSRHKKKEALEVRRAGHDKGPAQVRGVGVRLAGPGRPRAPAAQPPAGPVLRVYAPIGQRLAAGGLPGSRTRRHSAPAFFPHCHAQGAVDFGPLGKGPGSCGVGAAGARCLGAHPSTVGGEEASSPTVGPTPVVKGVAMSEPAHDIIEVPVSPDGSLIVPAHRG